MSNFVDYKVFSSQDLAVDFTTLLESNEIAYEIDDSSMRFSLIPLENLNGKVIVRIQDFDVQKADNLVLKQTSQIDDGHYLFTFSNDDLIDVIANPMDWTTKEVSIADYIIKQRCIVVSDQDIQLAKVKCLIEKQKEKSVNKEIPISKAHNWFLAIGIISIINTFLNAGKLGFVFIFGLGYTQFVDGIFLSPLFMRFQIFGIFISILMACFFILLWYYSKAKENWAYILGIILYFLDIYIFIIAKDWKSIVFHLIALILMILGFLKVLKSKKNVA
jgi:hypothetical protein